GAALVIVEATAVCPEGRISPKSLGLYSDDNEKSLKRIVDFCKDIGQAPIGIQLDHSGRKGARLPAAENRKLITKDSGGWQTVAPSAIAWAEGHPVPKMLDRAGMDEVKAQFVAAVKRSDRIGIDLVEGHFAHGYLLHQFLSPITNQRDDDYGGTPEKRLRFPLEVFDAMRAACPTHKPMGVRVSATDWIDGGWDLEATIEFGKQLVERGCDFIVASSGGIAPQQAVVAGPGYQVPFAEAIRRETKLPTMAIGLITEPIQADTIVRTGQADMIALARGMMYNPRWPWHAAVALGGRTIFPDIYWESHPYMKAQKSGEEQVQFEGAGVKGDGA
ncbi:MAG: NADH:flavin oxidoreductase/NADH oxidase, partial [Proteobacteria bacterium]|nr:NADH:flavin oxidoreductase/NADH oxidase [Pseudomonadota bacterium]